MRRLCLGLCLALGAGGLGATPKPEPTRPGVVVEDVAKGSDAEVAGIKPGDVLVSWERAPNPPANSNRAKGNFRDVTDFLLVFWEQSPRGPFTLHALRDGTPITFTPLSGHWYNGSRTWMLEGSFTLLSDSWGISARPTMAPELLAEYEKGMTLRRAGHIQAAATLWTEAASRIETTRPPLARWLYTRAADTLSVAKAWQLADQALDHAAALAQGKQDLAVLGEIWYRRGWSQQWRRDWHAAGAAYTHAGKLWSVVFGESLTLAMVKASLALLAFQAGHSEWGDALVLEVEAMHLREKLAPVSMPVAHSLASMCRIERYRGNLEAAASLCQRSLEMARRLNPDGLNVANSLNSLTVLATDRGQLSLAEKLGAEALDIQRRHSPPGTPDFANTLHNLSVVAFDRGDIALAEQRSREALEIRHRVIPGSDGEAMSLSALGSIAFFRGDLVMAEERYDEELKMARRRHSPTEYIAADALQNLGMIAAKRGDIALAESRFREAFEYFRRHDPVQAVNSLSALGDLKLEGGDRVEAESYLEQALQIANDTFPDGQTTYIVLMGLARVALDRHEIAKAETLYKRALVYYQRTSPGSAYEAEALYGLGLTARQGGDRRAALDYFRRAVDSTERQKGRLGGSEDIKAAFAAKYANYYRDYLDLLMELGRDEDAFNTLERFRARSFLRMLAARDLVLSSEVAAELERARTVTDFEYDRTQARVLELNPKENAEEIDEALAHLRGLRQKQEEVEDKIKRASPHYAALLYPQPLDLATTRAALEPGTLLLSYSVGKEKSFLFVVSSDPKRGPALSVVALPVGEKPLRESVEAFRRLINRNEPSPDLLARSRSLYDTLIKPAEASIGKHDRLLILPDGSLHTLPWAALVRSGKAEQPRYLVEWKPIHTAVSATVYAELKKSRRGDGSSEPAVEVAAFGDPKYPAPVARKTAVMRGDVTEEEEEEEEAAAGPLGDPELDAVMRGGHQFKPLPRSRQEVETIASLYAPKSETYVGTRATEESARSVGKDVPLIHYACHAYVNARFPLDSALVFTIPEKRKEGQDNGLLQAWEIFERVRIDADLVTLSACETGLGKEMGGEGLIGLTRAFQFAGARSVLASLWKVEDSSTGKLMERFYQHLKSGKTKDEALRLAQIDLIRSPDYSQPRDWAAFQLNGDWK